MKFIKKLMYIILVLLALGCAFVLACSFNPDITKKVAALLYPEMQELAEAAEDNLDTGQEQDVVKILFRNRKRRFMFLKGQSRNIYGNR